MSPAFTVLWVLITEFMKGNLFTHFRPILHQRRASLGLPAGLPHGGGGVRAKLVQASGHEHGVKCGPRTAQRAVEKHFEADVPQWDDFRSVSRGS